MKTTSPYILAGTLLASLSASAQIDLQFLTNPGNLGAATQTWTVQADGSSIAVTDGTNFDTALEGLTGSLTGATGSFTMTLSATYNFNETDFTRTLSTGDGAGGTNKWAYSFTTAQLGPVTPLNSSINMSNGDAIVLGFDLSNLTLNPGTSLQVDNLLIRNEGGVTGLFVSYLESGTSTGVQLTGSGPGSIASAAGDGVRQDVFQVVGTGDELALWVDGGSQKRLMGFQVSVIPEPSSYALHAGMLALAAVCIRQRRR
jgi:hypothetical protein